MWALDQIAFDLSEPTDEPIISVTITTPAGKIELMAEPRQIGRLMILRGVHIQSGIVPNGLGIVRLRAIAEAAMKEFGYDSIEVEGARRTTGANPGRNPGTLRFSRKP